MSLPPPIAYRAAHLGLRLYWRLARPVTLGVRVLALDGDRVLLIRHTYQSGWFLPGGGVKRGETLEAAARRELHEETGLSAESLDLAGLFTGTSEGKTDHVAVYRTAIAGQPHSRSPEVAEARWFSMAALPAGAARGTRRCVAGCAQPGPVRTGRW